MSRRKTDEEVEAECQAADEVRALQAGCSHYNCKPIEWYWSGQVREMFCLDCGLRDFKDEVE